MLYDDAVAAFFAPRPPGTPVPAAVLQGSPARRLRDAVEPLATHPIWAREVNEALAGLGLDFLGAYVWGRAAALGNPTAGAAAAAFAWFEPGLVAGVLGAGRAAAGREALLEVRDRGTAASVARVLGAEDPAALASAADRLLAAARAVPVLGRPLLAGLLARPLPDSPAGRLQRACELLREARGDAHVASTVAAGLDAVEANVLTELWLGMELGSYSGTRGWPADAISAAADRLSARGWVVAGALTAAGERARRELEDVTDRAMAPAVAVLGELGELDPLLAQLSAWGDRCTATGAFPQDHLKRAAG